MFILALLSLLAFEPPPVPPVVGLPPELDLCIETAERCIAGAESDGAQKGCIVAYETCSSGFKEAHEYSCRTAHVDCVLHDHGTKDMVIYCELVAVTCG